MKYIPDTAFRLSTLISQQDAATAHVFVEVRKNPELQTKHALISGVVAEHEAQFVSAPETISGA
jgi:hypothetical protein